MTVEKTVKYDRTNEENQEIGDEFLNPDEDMEHAAVKIQRFYRGKKEKKYIKPKKSKKRKEKFIDPRRVQDLTVTELGPYHEPDLKIRAACRFHEPLSLKAKIKQRILKERNKQKI